MRYCKDIMLEKAVLHIISTDADEAILAEKELAINEVVEAFVRKHVVKSLKSDNTYSFKFLDHNQSKVSQLIKRVRDNNDEFMDVSKELSEHMFNVTNNSDIPSGGILIVQYIADEQRCFAIMKLDYQSLPTHSIRHENDEDLIDVVPNDSLLPKATQELKKCAFFIKCAHTEDDDSGLEVIVLDKKQLIEDGNEEYFLQDFLEGIVTIDGTFQTRRFKEVIEKWTQKNLSDQIELANTLRAITNDALLSDEIINIEKFTANALSSVEDKEVQQVLTEGLKEHLADEGYKLDSEFLVDKTWVEKKMKTKVIKTDTGLVIKGDIDLFKDAQKFVVRQNGDGSVDYVIKNVRNVVERKGSQ